MPGPSLIVACADCECEAQDGAERCPRCGGGNFRSYVWSGWTEDAMTPRKDRIDYNRDGRALLKECLWASLFIGVLLALLACLDSCTYVRTPEGTVLWRWGYDTTVEGLEYRAGPTSQPTTFKVNKANSEAKALDLALEAIKAAKAAQP